LASRSARAHWTTTPADDVVLMLAGANVAVYGLWRLADPRFRFSPSVVSAYPKGILIWFPSAYISWWSLLMSRFGWTCTRAGCCTCCSQELTATLIRGSWWIISWFVVWLHKGLLLVL
jgi:hypothetical protein